MRSHPLILELPGYKLPSFRNALLYTADRSWVFIRQAGTIILFISIVLWVLATYPKSGEAPGAVVLMEQAEAIKAADAAEAARLELEAARESHRYALEQSMAGQLGKLIEPIVRPLGFDWQIGIGI
ncbi:MAG: ferrous iron transport protein B, partial [Verrucomicrobiales bacterium]